MVCYETIFYLFTCKSIDCEITPYNVCIFFSLDMDQVIGRNVDEKPFITPIQHRKGHLFILTKNAVTFTRSNKYLLKSSRT